MTWLWIGLALLAGYLVGQRLSRRRRNAPSWEPADVDRTQRFLPDPAIQWLGRAHAARAVFTAIVCNAFVVNTFTSIPTSEQHTP